MTLRKTSAAIESQSASLEIRRTIRGPPERVFEAWTQPTHLKTWWGPASVRCVDAEIDLRVGGNYRIANEFPDGKLVWIVGEYETVEPPRKLVYTWRTEPGSRVSERVTVQFEPRNGETELIITHERIPNTTLRDMHKEGWNGCLDGLAEYLKDS